MAYPMTRWTRHTALVHGMEASGIGDGTTIGGAYPARRRMSSTDITAASGSVQARYARPRSVSDWMWGTVRLNASYPATASREVTIFAPTAFLADALDDAAFILGPKKGIALVDSYPDCSTLIVDAKNQVWMSKSLEGKLQRTNPPTDGI